jgi:hypothetical protein
MSVAGQRYNENADERKLPMCPTMIITKGATADGSMVVTDSDEAKTAPVDEIPPVAHTYAYFDGNYG